ncbi:XRE family transcriptional regulator [Streptomyces sp. AD55]|uniref:telomere-protecting terminal protein Tpg n=1 Tax=Streptomyces sp. AD55 TaxID=3242895 RepID=UPI0035297601
MARRIRPAGATADDALVLDAIERAAQEGFTREPPKTLKARVNFLVRPFKSTRAVAEEIGVSRRSVERYRSGERRHPPRDIADRIDAAVRAHWQPGVRARRRRQATTATGIVVAARARFGYTAPVGTTDHGRVRRITLHLPADYARRLFDAGRGVGPLAPDEVVAEGIQELCFKDSGRRAGGLEVEFTDIDCIDFSC